MAGLAAWPRTRPRRASSPESVTTIPLFARVHLAHAVVQRIAEECRRLAPAPEGTRTAARPAPPGALEHRRRRAGAPEPLRPRCEEALRARGWEPVSHAARRARPSSTRPTGGIRTGVTPTCTRAGRVPTVSPEDTFAALAEEQLRPAHRPRALPGAGPHRPDPGPAPPRRPVAGDAISSSPGTRSPRSSAPPSAASPSASAHRSLSPAALGRPRGTTAATAATPCGASTARVAAGSTSGGPATAPPTPRRRVRGSVWSAAPVSTATTCALELGHDAEPGGGPARPARSGSAARPRERPAHVAAPRSGRPAP